MAWLSVGLLSVGVVAAVRIWWRWRRPYTFTSHNVQCPLHGDKARINVCTDVRAKRPYVNVVACSLHSSGPVFVPNKIAWVPEMSYYAAGLAKSTRGPLYRSGVPCRKACLAILHHADMHGMPRHVHHLSGVSDSLELARAATAQTVAETPVTQAPWSYSG